MPSLRQKKMFYILLYLNYAGHNENWINRTLIDE